MLEIIWLLLFFLPSPAEKKFFIEFITCGLINCAICNDSAIVNYDIIHIINHLLFSSNDPICRFSHDTFLMQRRNQWHVSLLVVFFFLFFFCDLEFVVGMFWRIHTFFYKRTLFWLSLGVPKKILNSGSDMLRCVLIQISILS